MKYTSRVHNFYDLMRTTHSGIYIYSFLGGPSIWTQANNTNNSSPLTGQKPLKLKCEAYRSNVKFQVNYIDYCNYFCCCCHLFNFFFSLVFSTRLFFLVFGALRVFVWLLLLLLLIVGHNFTIPSYCAAATEPRTYVCIVQVSRFRLSWHKMRNIGDR